MIQRNGKNIRKNELRKVSESTKKIVASNQNWRCLMCHNLLDYSYEIDHNVPLFAGGTNHISYMLYAEIVMVKKQFLKEMKIFINTN